MGRPKRTWPEPKPTGNKHDRRWVIRPMVDVRVGNEVVRREQAKYSPAHVITKKQALAWRDEVCMQLNRRAETVQAQTPLADVIAAYRLNGFDALKPNTRGAYDVALRLRTEPFFGKMRLCDIDPLKCQQWANWMTNKGWSKGTIEQTFGCFRSMWEAVADWGYTTQRCPVSRRIKVSSHKAAAERRAATASEVLRVRSAVPEHLRLAVDLCAFTGLRVGEVAAIQRRHVDYERGVIVVRESISRIDDSRVSVKNSKTRIVAIGGLKADLLVALPPAAAADTPLIGMACQALQQAIRRGFVAAGIQAAGKGAHMLRRFYATNARRFASMADVQATLGHADPAMTMHYVTESDEERGRVTDALRNQVFFGNSLGPGASEPRKH